MRVTTGSLSRGYNTRLNKVLGNLNLSNEKVTTKRKYLKASENPALSVRAKRLERDMSNTEDYLSNVNSVIDTYTSIESAMMEISDHTDELYADILSADTGTTSHDQRTIIAAKIRKMQEGAVKALNARFEDKFLFGGYSSKEQPFALDDAGKLTFRGIDVDSTDPDDQAKLKAMSEEKAYVDLGFGLEFNPDDTLKDTSAFNVLIPGINFVGYGVDSEGKSNNLMNTLTKLADLLEKEPYDSASVKDYAKKLDTQRTTMLINITQMGSTTIFLQNTKSRLEDNEVLLNKKIEDTEYVDLAEQIMDFTEQQYVYQAALKMGGKVLSNSFIDYMN